MQGCYAAAHDQAAEAYLKAAQCLSTHHIESERRGEDRNRERSQNCRPVVDHRKGQLEGQNPLEMHLPDADTHRYRTTGQPCRSSPAPCGGYASCEIEGGIGCGDGD